MNSLTGYMSRSVYKIRIILAFGIITALLLLLMSRVGYYFARTVYLNQLNEHTGLITKIFAAQITNDLTRFRTGDPSLPSSEYFKKIFKDNLYSSLTPDIYILNNKFNVIVSSDTNQNRIKTEPFILQNKNEIQRLPLKSGFVSPPFKGSTGKWYLWGFYRFDEQFWLAVKEDASIRDKIDDFSFYFWLTGLSGVIIALIAGWLVARSVTRPIKKLADFSSEIGKGNFSAPAPDKMYGEIGVLAAAMEKMKHSLKKDMNEHDEILLQIVHKQQTSINEINQLANLAKKNIDDAKDKDYLNKIIQEADGIKKIISSYLDYSTPVHIKPGWVSLEPLIGEIQNLYIHKIENLKCEFNINLTLDKLYFDADHLKKVLSILIENSLDAITERGKITIESDYIGNNMMLSVSDNGSGISTYNVYEVFKPFVTSEKSGNGLELAICKKLCIQNNADLIAANNKEGGATFTIIKEVENKML